MPRGEPVIRQWNIVKAIQSHRFGISADEIAERLEFSKRQIQRDLRVLIDSGFPIHYDERNYGKRFWKLKSNFIESDGIILSFTEMISLYLGQKMMIPLLGTQLGGGILTLMEKIKATVPAKVLEYFDSLEEVLIVKNPVYQNYARYKDVIFMLNRAITDSKAVSLTYYSMRLKEKYTTVICPYGMIFYGANLYVIGYMEKYSQVRTLKINRVSDTKLTNKSFERPINFSLKRYTRDSFGVIAPGTGKLQQLKLKLSGWAAQNVREQSWHSSQVILEDTKDYVIVQYTLSNTAEFKRWVLGFAGEAVVLSPGTLASEIHEEAKKIARLYEK